MVGAPLPTVMSPEDPERVETRRENEVAEQRSVGKMWLQVGAREENGERERRSSTIRRRGSWGKLSLP